MLRKSLLALSATVLAVVSSACASGDGANGGQTDLQISYQDTAFPALIQASGVLDGADFTVTWSNLTGPAANLQALYGGAIDVGHMGDTSLIIEQANAATPWPADDPPLSIVAGWRNDFDPDHSPLVTAVRTSAGITDPSQVRDHTWAYNFGGYNHAQYLVSLVQAGLTPDEIEPVQFADGASSAAAFNSGRTDVYSGAQGAILTSLQSGEAAILFNDQDTGIPALNVWTASRAALADDAKNGALEDFFDRMSGFWSWYDANPDQAKSIIKNALKIDDARTEFEYQVRSGHFWAFDDELIDQEQQVAQSMFDGGAIPSLPDVSIGFDPRYNEVQEAVATPQAQAAP